MIKHLWVRLSLAFGLVTLGGMFSIAAAARHLELEQSETSIMAAVVTEPDGLQDELTAYYIQHQSWEGVERILNQRYTHYADTLDTSFELLLFDNNRHIVYRAGQSPNIETREVNLPIGSADAPYGYLHIEMGEDVDRVEDFQILSALILFTGVVSVAAGIVISRNLTAPLNKLADSARHLQQDLSHRIELRGSQEITAVAVAFNEMAESLYTSQKLRNNLVADVAHELRTPLSVIQSNLYGILDDVYPLEKSQITVLYDQTRLLSRLVNDLHQLSQAEAHQLAWHMQLTDLEKLLRDALIAFELVAEDKAIHLNIQIAENLPKIKADEERLNQVFYNLINNALRHTPTGGQIDIRVEALPDQIKITVADNGEGIAPEHLPHIFERFYRTDPSRQRYSGNTGLGLAIVKAIVQAHHGTINATSGGIDKGATFCVWLPLQQP